MEIDDIRESWRRQRRSLREIGLSEQELARRANDRRRGTATERLAARYLRVAILAAVTVPLSAAWATSEIFEGPYMEPFAIFLSCYFLLAAAMDFTLYRRVKQIDIYTMPTAEVARRARGCRRCHLRCVMTLIPLMVAAMVYMAWQFAGDRSLLCGMGVGLVIGLAAGLRLLRRFMADYRALREE